MQGSGEGQIWLNKFWFCRKSGWKKRSVKTVLDQEKTPGWVQSSTTPIIWLPDCDSWLVNNELGAPSSLLLQNLAEGWTEQGFCLQVWLGAVLLTLLWWSLILFGGNFQQPERIVCHSHFKEMIFPRPWGDLVGVLDIRQRCYQPSQPIPSHARARVKVTCSWTNRDTGRAGTQLHPTYTHCSFNNFDANYFYKSFQVSWKHTKTCTNGWVCHYQVGQFLLDCTAAFSRGKLGNRRRFLCIYEQLGISNTECGLKLALWPNLLHKIIL